MKQPDEAKGFFQHPFVLSAFAAAIPVAIGSAVNVMATLQAAETQARATEIEARAIQEAGKDNLAGQKYQADTAALTAAQMAQTKAPVPTAPTMGASPSLAPAPRIVLPNPAKNPAESVSKPKSVAADVIYVSNQEDDNRIWNVGGQFFAGFNYEIKSYACWQWQGNSYCGFYIKPDSKAFIAASGIAHTEATLSNGVVLPASLVSVQTEIMRPPEYNGVALGNVFFNGGRPDEYGLSDYAGKRLFLLFTFPSLGNLKQLEKIQVSMGGNDPGVVFKVKYVGKS